MSPIHTTFDFTARRPLAIGPAVYAKLHRHTGRRGYGRVSAEPISLVWGSP